jgi:hypothetical protein
VALVLQRHFGPAAGRLEDAESMQLVQNRTG